MNPFILTEGNFPTSPTGIIVPFDAIKRCYSISFLQTFLVNKSSTGIKFKISKIKIGGKISIRRNPKEYDGKDLSTNEFVITREVVENLFSGFESINFNIITDSLDNFSLIIERSTDKCGDNGDGGGDGLKVKLPS